MRLFIQKILYFLLLLILAELLIIGLPTPISLKNSLYFSKIDKDQLLKSEKSPRLILVGGSNLSFGINSELIKDSLQLNTINTSLHASIGLIYMMDQTMKYVRQGDIILIAPEYGNFYDNNAYGAGGYELLVSTLEVSHDYFDLRYKQILSTMKYFPQYTRSKINFFNYFLAVDTNDIYSRKSFNKYGDAKNHWNLPKPSQVNSSFSFGTKFNQEILNELVIYQDKLNKKGVKLLLSFPCLQESNYISEKEKILKVESEFRKTKIPVLGDAKTFVFPDSMMFNSAYHLSKPALDERTRRLIQGLKVHLN